MVSAQYMAQKWKRNTAYTQAHFKLLGDEMRTMGSEVGLMLPFTPNLAWDCPMVTYLKLSTLLSWIVLGSF